MAGSPRVPFAPCVRALRKSASECGGSAVMCIGYDARCVQKRVPGVFSNPEKGEGGKPFVMSIHARRSRRRARTARGGTTY